jgi:RimJ/RimL family protein N-acetyltransferase
MPELLGVGDGENSFHNVVIAGAATKIAFEAKSHVALRWLGILVEQTDGGHHHAWRAVAALEAVMFTEGLLHRVHLVALGQTFNRSDRLAIGLGGEHRARLHRFSIEVNGACATRRCVAANVGTC